MVFNSCLLKAGEGRAGLCQQGGPSYRRAATLQGHPGLFSRTSKAFLHAQGSASTLSLEPGPCLGLGRAGLPHL